MNGFYTVIMQRLFDTQIEVRGIYADKGRRVALLVAANNIPAYGQQFRQTLKRLYKAHHRQSVHLMMGDKALGNHLRTTNTLELSIGIKAF